MSFFCSNYPDLLCDDGATRMLTPPPLPQDIIFHAARFSDLPTVRDNDPQEQPAGIIHTEDRYNERPKHSFLDLVMMAIKSCPDNEATLQEIYDFIANRWPFFRGNRLHWRNSVRHNLTVRKCFQRIISERSPSKGVVWKYSEEETEADSLPTVIPNVQLTPPMTPREDTPMSLPSPISSTTRARTQLFAESASTEVEFRQSDCQSENLPHSLKSNQIMVNAPTLPTNLPRFKTTFSNNVDHPMLNYHIQPAENPIPHYFPPQQQNLQVTAQETVHTCIASPTNEMSFCYTGPDNQRSSSHMFTSPHYSGCQSPFNNITPRITSCQTDSRPYVQPQRGHLSRAGKGNTLPSWAFDFPLMYMPPPVTRF